MLLQSENTLPRRSELLCPPPSAHPFFWPLKFPPCAEPGGDKGRRRVESDFRNAERVMSAVTFCYLCPSRIFFVRSFVLCVKHLRRWKTFRLRRRRRRRREQLRTTRAKGERRTRRACRAISEPRSSPAICLLPRTTGCR